MLSLAEYGAGVEVPFARSPFCCPAVGERVDGISGEFSLTGSPMLLAMTEDAVVVSSCSGGDGIRRGMRADEGELTLT